MTYIIQYRSNTIMPPDVTDILETAKSSLIELSREPDKATVLFDVMRKELINWLALHERFDDYYCRDCAEYIMPGAVKLFPAMIVF